MQQRTLKTRVSDARYRATRPLRTVRGSVRNWRNRRFLETGRGFALERVTRPVRSSLPVYRNRINPATGRPRRDDVQIGAIRDREAARRRKAHAGKVAAHDRAVRELWANSDRERKAGIRDETPQYQRLNARVSQLRAPLSPIQRTAAATMHRLDRADRRQGRSR